MPGGRARRARQRGRRGRRRAGATGALRARPTSAGGGPAPKSQLLALFCFGELFGGDSCAGGAPVAFDEFLAGSAPRGRRRSPASLAGTRSRAIAAWPRTAQSRALTTAQFPSAARPRSGRRRRAPCRPRRPSTRRPPDDAAAVEAQQRDAQRAVAVEHVERAVARAEGRADDVARGDARAALDGVDEALGREEGDAVARRALVSLIVREGELCRLAGVAPAAGRGVAGPRAFSSGWQQHHPLFGLWYTHLRPLGCVLRLLRVECLSYCCAIPP